MRKGFNFEVVTLFKYSQIVGWIQELLWKVLGKIEQISLLFEAWED